MLRWSRLALSLSVLWMLPGVAFALPSTFVQEGFVVTQRGPLDGEHNLRIRIYSEPLGRLLFEEDYPRTMINDGYYAVQIGSNRPLCLTVCSSKRASIVCRCRWRSRASPRIELSKVPAAFVAGAGQ